MSLVDRWSILCLLASVVVVAIVISIASGRTAIKKKFRAKHSVKYFLRTLWESFELLVGQGKFSHISAVPRLMWLTLTVGLFIIVSGIFLNLLRTEQVAQREPDQIDSLADLLDEFSWQEPTLMTNLYTSSLLDLTKNNTPENRLIERIKSNENNTYSLETTENSTQEPSQVTVKKYLDKGGRYLLLENSFWFPNVFCHIVPEMFDVVHVSKGTVLDGILVALYNSKSDPRLVKYMSYRLSNKLELGFTAYETNQVVREVCNIIGYWELGKENATRCRFREDPPKTESDMQFKMSYARSALYFNGSAVVLAVFIGICELSLRQCVKMFGTAQGEISNWIKR
ncbi:hypothetical protein HDE_00334 [Halotydeus destructor]|nr:hypothetical protein HDE_00334 [Halotydeus destructor]